MSQPVYPYGRKFQIQVLGLLVKDPKFYVDYDEEVLKPSYFEDYSCSVLYNLIKDEYESLSKVKRKDEKSFHLDGELLRQSLTDFIDKKKIWE